MRTASSTGTGVHDCVAVPSCVGACEDGRQIALEAARKGYRVFPCRDKVPFFAAGTHTVWAPPGKAAGLARATSDPATIAKHWPTGANVGTTADDRVFIFDIDVPKGDAPLRERQAIATQRYETLRDYPFALWVRTPSGGYHGYALRWPDGVDVPRTGPYTVGDGELWGELRGNGNAYVVLPGSRTRDGEYQVLHGELLATSALPMAPAALIDAVLPYRPTSNGTPNLVTLAVRGAGASKTIEHDPEAYAHGILQRVRERLGPVKVGRNQACRNEALTLGRWVGGYQRAGLTGLTREDAYAALIDAMQENGDYAEDTRKAERTIASGLADGMASAYVVTVKPRTSKRVEGPGPTPRDPSVPGPEPIYADAARQVSARSVVNGGISDPTMTPELAEELAAFRNTDLGNGERLAHLFGDHIRDVPGLGWYVWDGMRWVRDASGEVIRLAARMVRLLYVASAQLPDGAARADLAKHAARSESLRALRATVESARHGQSIRSLTVSADQLDADPDLFNAENGTIHLPSGHLRPHDPRDLITKLAPVAYDPNAQAPMWEAFQHLIADGDADLMAYKHRAFGYTITGHTTEQALFIPYGLGSNGKSTELESIAAAIGDNAMTAAYNTFASMRDGSVQRFGLARLAGARFVRAGEGEQGARLAEGTVKLVTGGERVPAEFKGRDVFEYTPRFKLWLATNHRPETRGTDHGLWRRIKLIPYARTITDEERDPAFPAKLRSELPGILAWLVRGAREWYQRGLGACEAVDDATKAYRDDMDILGPFLNAVVRQDDPRAFEGSAHLYAAYAEWMLANHDDPITQTAFGRALTERGFRKRHTRSGNVYDGLQLTNDGEALADANIERQTGR